jgi:hypothetical protein
MGPMRVIEAFLDHIARSERRLIVTSGMGAITDNTSGGSIAYRTSKAAVNMAMRSVAADAASPALWSIPGGSGRVWAEPEHPCRCRIAWLRCYACSTGCSRATQASSSTTTVASIAGEQVSQRCRPWRHL